MSKTPDLGLALVWKSFEHTDMFVMDSLIARAAGFVTCTNVPVNVLTCHFCVCNNITMFIGFHLSCLT